MTDLERDSWEALANDFPDLKLSMLGWAQGVMRTWNDRPDYDGLAERLFAGGAFLSEDAAAKFVLRAKALRLP